MIRGSIRTLVLIALALALLSTGACAAARGGINADDSNALFDAYVASLFQVPSADSRYEPRQIGNALKGKVNDAYNELADQIRKTAAGQNSSTEFVTNTDMSALTDEDLNMLICALLTDFPCELYWYDKTVGFLIGDHSMSMTVCKEFALGEYQMDTTRASAAFNAAENARAIVNRYDEYSDLDRLRAYRDEICALVKYNSAAVNENWDYGNPWQLVWVFDNDPNTDVVCEGYAKAFQYLCDMTHFNSPVISYSILGTVKQGPDDEPGWHMWNVVHMPDGYNYLVDVTWCDGEEEPDDDFFMRSTVGGSIYTGYDISYGSSESPWIAHYEYDADMLDLFPASDLELRAEEAALGIEINHSRFPDENFLLWIMEFLDSDGDIHLSDAEIANVREIDVSELEISSLEGIQYFGALEQLECQNNHLTKLDLSDNPSLQYLDCCNNALTGLDVRANSMLSTLSCSDNPKIRTLDISKNTELKVLDCENDGLTNLDLRQNKALVDVFCSGNALSSLDLSGNASLEILYCDGNKLEALNVSRNPALTCLYCPSNAIKKLDVRRCPDLVKYISIDHIIIDRGAGILAYGIWDQGDDSVPVGLACDLTVSITGGNPVNLFKNTLTLPAKLTEIGDDAFNGIDAEFVRIPEGCKTIGKHAFANCTSLIAVFIPDSLTRLDKSAFEGCADFGFITNNARVQRWAEKHGVWWIGR